MKKWHIDLQIVRMSKPGTFKTIVQQDFIKKTDANKFYRELRSKVYRHYCAKYGMMGVDSIVMCSTVLELARMKHRMNSLASIFINCKKEKIMSTTKDG